MREISRSKNALDASASSEVWKRVGVTGLVDCVNVIDNIHRCQLIQRKFLWSRKILCDPPKTADIVNVCGSRSYLYGQKHHFRCRPGSRRLDHDRLPCSKRSRRDQPGNPGTRSEYHRSFELPSELARTQLQDTEHTDHRLDHSG